MQSIEDDTRRQGQVVHPDIAANYERMNRALESARKALDSGDLPGARQVPARTSPSQANVPAGC